MENKSTTSFALIDPDKAADTREIAEKLGKLPMNQLMYVAGAIHMATVLSNTGQDDDQQKGA